MRQVPPTFHKFCIKCPLAAYRDALFAFEGASEQWCRSTSIARGALLMARGDLILYASL